MVTGGGGAGCPCKVDKDSKGSLLMTMQQTVTVERDWRGALIANSDKIIRFGGLAFVALAGFAGAFRHMHDWTAEALPQQADWLCWANAVISEILPTVSFLSWRDRIEQKRKAGMPLLIFLASGMVSLIANLSATGLRIHGDTYFLAALPMLSIMVLFKMVLGDLDYARKDRERKAAEAARRAELDRRRERDDAEREAERARNFEREQAELAAELHRTELAQAAERERIREERAAAERIRLAEIEQAEVTRREQMAAAERAEVRRAEQERERVKMELEAAALAEAERIRAEGEAERARAQADALRAQTAAAEQAATLLRGRHRAEADHDATAAGASVTPIRKRRPREETEVIAAATLAALPAGTTRDQAVRAVAVALDCTERYARKIVPADWSAGSSAGGEADAA